MATLTIQSGIETGTIVDYGFENGVHGTALSSGIWSTIGSPARKEYTSAYSAIGLKSAWLQAPASAYAGVYESQSSGMTADTAEIRWWVRFPTDTSIVAFADQSDSSNQPFHLRFGNTAGVLHVYTDRTATGYTTSGYTSIATGLTSGWYQFRVVFNFTGNTYQFYYRTYLYGAWIPCKAAGAPNYNIPMRGTNDITQNGGFSAQPYNSAQVWIDDFRYSNTGISEDTSTKDCIICGDPAFAGYNYGRASNNVGCLSTTNFKYRALLWFDLTSIPKESVTSAALDLYHYSTVPAGATPMSTSVYRITQNVNWGEGNKTGAAATTGEATWNSYYHSSGPWSSPGLYPNSVSTTALATITPTQATAHWETWSLDPTEVGKMCGSSPTYPNVGFMLKTTESAVICAVLLSRDNAATPSLRPKLTLTYTLPTQTITSPLDGVVKAVMTAANNLDASILARYNVQSEVGGQIQVRELLEQYVLGTLVNRAAAQHGVDARVLARSVSQNLLDGTILACFIAEHGLLGTVKKIDAIAHSISGRVGIRVPYHRMSGGVVEALHLSGGPISTSGRCCGEFETEVSESGSMNNDYE